MEYFANPRLRSFATLIEEERSFCNLENGNRLAFALRVLFHKYRKIVLLHERAIPLILKYAEHLENLKTWKSGALSEGQQNQINNTSNLITDIEMDFESFFMYGAILCDDVAQLFLWLFGPARGVKLGKHKELSKNFAAYAKALSLSYGEDFVGVAKSLESDLCEFRDKQIVHDFHTRKIDSVALTNDYSDALMTYGMIYPKDTDTYVTSKPWGELLRAVDQYISLFLQILQDNRDKSHFYTSGQRKPKTKC